MNRPSDLQSLDPAPLGADDPQQVLQWIRQEFADLPAEAPTIVYEALRAVVWKLLSARVYGDGMGVWHDVLRQASSLCSGSSVAIGERLRALSDLALESTRFGAIHSVDLAMSREHVTEILRAIQALGGVAKRSDVIKATRLRQANLSRILNSLTAIGLVERREQGREVLVSLTSLARDQLSRPPNGKSGLEVTPSLVA